MQRSTKELTETYQALDDAGTVYTIQVFTEIVHKLKPDGSKERIEGAKTHQTVDGHPVQVYEDGSLRDMHDGITMRRMESP